MAQVIGLDVGSHSLRAAVYDASENSLLAVNEEVFDGSNKNQSLKDFLSSNDLSRSPTWAALNDQEIFVRDMRVPFVNEDQIRQTIQYSAEEVIPDDVESYLLDYRLIEVEESQTHLMVMAARREAVGRKLQQLQEAGIDPEGVTYAGLALYTLGVHISKNEGIDEPFMILDIGASSADIVVGDLNKLLYVRSILTQGFDPKKKVDRKRLEQILKEVKRTLWSGGVDGYAGVLWLSGGLAQAKGIEKFASNFFDYPTQVIPAHLALSENKSQEENLAPFAQSVGLALMGSQPKEKYVINFRRGEYVRRPFILKVRVPIVALLLVLVGLVFWDGVRYVEQRKALAKQRVAHLTWEVQQFVDFWGQENLPKTNEIEADPSWLVKEFERHLERVDDKLTVYPDAVESIRLLSLHLGKFPEFKLKRLDVGKSRVTLQGSFPNKNQLQAFEDEISKNAQEAFRGVDTRGRGEIQGDGTIEFTCDLPLNRESF